MGWNSAGFEIGNTLDRRAYPTARAKRAGPPPSSQPPGFDPLAARDAPIRSRTVAWQLLENTGRATISLGPFVGPGLIKRLDIGHLLLLAGATVTTLQIFRDTAAYLAGNNQSPTPTLKGVPVWESFFRRDDALVNSVDGGLTGDGNSVRAANYLIDHYVADAQWFVALTLNNPTVGGSGGAGTLLIYEGILPSDFPAILG